MFWLSPGRKRKSGRKWVILLPLPVAHAFIGSPWIRAGLLSHLVIRMQVGFLYWGGEAVRQNSRNSVNSTPTHRRFFYELQRCSSSSSVLSELSKQLLDALFHRVCEKDGIDRIEAHTLGVDDINNTRCHCKLLPYCGLSLVKACHVSVLQ